MSSNIKFRSLDNLGNNLFVIDSSLGVTNYHTGNATSVTNGGSLTIVGGAAIGKSLYVGDSLDVIGNINFTGNLYKNGSIVNGSGSGGTVSSQWGNGDSSSIYYTSGNVIIKDLNLGSGSVSGKLNISDTTDVSTASSASVVITGGLGIAKSVLVGGNLNLGGVNTQFGGSFAAANNVVTPANIPGFILSNNVFGSFVATINVKVISLSSSLTAQYTLEGVQMSNGWVLNDSTFGDDVGIIFNITNNGQIQYKSSNITNWMSTTINYQVNGLNIASGYQSVVPTNGNVNISGNMTINSTTDVTSYSSASLVLSGGLGVSKSIFVGGNLNIAGIQSHFGGTFSAANNVSTPANVTGLLFPPSTIRSFTCILNITITCLNCSQIVSQITLEGIYNNATWALSDSFIGNDSEIIFTVDDSTGQVKYTSSNITNWVSTRINYSASVYYIYGNYEPRPLINNLEDTVFPGTVQILSTNVANTTTSASLVVSGGVSISKNAIIGSDLLVNGNLNVGGIQTYLGGTFSAANNVSTPQNVTGLVFPPATIQSFICVFNVTITLLGGSQIVSQITLEGVYNSSIWKLTESFIGDDSQITFTVDNSTGQVKYTSPDVTDWISTRINYSATVYYIYGNFEPLSLLDTPNDVVFPGTVQILSTNESDSSTSASLVVSGGVSIAKNARVGTDLLVNGKIKGDEIESTSTDFKIYSTNGNWFEFNGDAIGVYYQGMGYNPSPPNYITNSDHRIKENVNQISEPLSLIKRLNGYTFNFNKEHCDKVNIKQQEEYGFLANEVIDLVPCAVHGETNGVDQNGNVILQKMDYTKIVPILVESVKELLKKCEHYEKRIEQLEKLM